jgi:hypothetical protein
MAWGNRKWKNLISKARGTTKNVKKNYDLGGAESGKELILKVRGITKNIKKNHSLGGAESGEKKLILKVRITTKKHEEKPWSVGSRKWKKTHIES